MNSDHFLPNGRRSDMWFFYSLTIKKKKSCEWRKQREVSQKTCPEKIICWFVSWADLCCVVCLIEKTGCTPPHMEHICSSLPLNVLTLADIASTMKGYHENESLRWKKTLRGCKGIDLQSGFKYKPIKPITCHVMDSCLMPWHWPRIHRDPDLDKKLEDKWILMNEQLLGYICQKKDWVLFWHQSSCPWASHLLISLLPQSAIS